MKKFRISVNLVLGIIVGLETVIFILSQINLMSSYLTTQKIEYSFANINIIGWILAIVAFVVIVKVFLSIKSKKLSMYLILSVVTAAITTFLIWYLITIIFAYNFLNDKLLAFLNSRLGELVTISVVNFGLVFMVTVFVMVFWMMINRKVKYIQYISDEVRRIENDGFGKTIEVKGNDELTDLSMGINSMSIKLKDKLDKEKQIERNKNELISNVSHDLRTPLTSVIGYVTLLKENGFQDKDKFEEYIEVVERRVEGLNTLINELFEYTKLSSNEIKLERDRIDLIPVIKHLVNEYEILYQKNGFELECDFLVQHCYIIADINKMVRVFQNLLDNARKYAKSESKVMIRISEDVNHLYFEIQNQIEDNDKVEVDRLFERFYKGDTARSDTDSSGLGLAIVKRIVELHEGELSVVVEKGIIKFHMILMKR